MKITAYLAKIHNRNVKIYDTQKEISADIRIQFNLPSIITWKWLNKLSAIVTIIKWLIKNEDTTNKRENWLINALAQVTREEQAGKIERTYGKTETFKTINSSASQDGKP